jgi:hypothetical protein
MRKPINDRPIEEVAMEYAMLVKAGAPKAKFADVIDEREFQLIQELERRSGDEGSRKWIKQADDILKMVMP